MSDTNNLIIAGISTFAAETTPLFVGIMNIKLPEIFMQLFQVGAWGTAIGVGLITIYNFYKTNLKKQKNDEKH